MSFSMTGYVYVYVTIAWTRRCLAVFQGGTKYHDDYSLYSLLNDDSQNQSFKWLQHCLIYQQQLIIIIKSWCGNNAKSFAKVPKEARGIKSMPLGQLTDKTPPSNIIMHPKQKASTTHHEIRSLKQLRLPCQTHNCCFLINQFITD